MLKNFLFVIFALISLTAYAHQPDLSSTMLVEREDGSYILQVRAALTGFEYEVKAHYGEDSYPSPEKFQELVIDHLKENISIAFNESYTATLQNAYVKLGHETNAVFEIVGVPEKITSISVINSSFKNISRNQSALIILKEGYPKDQFILNSKNGHSMNLSFEDSKIIPIIASQSQTTSWSLIAIFSLLILIGFLLNPKLKIIRPIKRSS